MKTPATVTVASTRKGKVLRAFGDEMTVHLGGADTEGRLTVFTAVTPPGSGPPPHRHEREDEWFFPLEGRVEFFLDGQWQEVPVGGVVFAGRGSVHTFRNVGTTPLKMLIHTSPAGFETYFERCAEEFAKDGPPDMERIVQISLEHGLQFVDG
ncbi:MAG: cupin domain-containing protein [Acidobacteriota bacterium]